MSRKKRQSQDTTPGEAPQKRPPIKLDNDSGEGSAEASTSPKKASQPTSDAPETTVVPSAAPSTSGRAKPDASQDSAVSAQPADESPTEARTKLTKLPAFGFAADLLGSLETERKVSAAPVAVDVSNDVPAFEDEGPIFSFADTLTAAEKEAERQAAEARITTWITFALADETFAMPVEPVREVLRIHNITRVPHAPAPIRGVTNLRGRVIPVIDLRRRIGLAEEEPSRSSRIIVVSARGRLIGLLVDRVHQVSHLDLNLVQTPPDDVMTAQSDYITGVYHQGDELLLLLHVDRALTIKETPEEALSGAA